MHRILSLAIALIVTAVAPRLTAQSLSGVSATDSILRTPRVVRSKDIALSASAMQHGVPLRISELLQADSKLPITPAAVDLRPSCAMPVATSPARTMPGRSEMLADSARAERMPVAPSRCRNPMFRK